MKSNFLVRAVVILTLAVLLAGCGGAGPAPTGEGVDYMWEKDFAFFPKPAQVWVLHPTPHQEFNCWIWGEYWVNRTMIQGQFFLAQGVKAVSSSCTGVINGG